jgi:hypothetical protein
MKEYEVWSEGYSDNGGRSGAQFHGKVGAENFDEACVKLLGKHLDRNPDDSYRRGSIRREMEPGIARTQSIMNGGNYSIWACQLFDNEADARKSFG